MAKQAYQTSLSNPKLIRSSSGETVRNVPRRANRWHTFELVLANIKEGGRADDIGCEIVDHDEQTSRARRVSTGRMLGTLAPSRNPKSPGKFEAHWEILAAESSSI